MITKQKKLLAIIVASPLTQNIYDRIGAEILSESFELIIIDCLEWVREYVKKPEYNAVLSKYICQVDSESGFVDVLKRNRPAYILDFIGRGEYTRKIQCICKAQGTLYITHLLAPFPNPISQKKLLRSFFYSPITTINKIFYFVRRKIFQKNPLAPDVALLAGSDSKNAWTETAGKIIYTPSPAFYELRRVQSTTDINNNLSEQEYILFIDDCLALSFDFDLGSHKTIIQAEEYFSLLNNFFTKIEAVFNMPVVIAAHPNGKEYPGYCDYFNNRKVVFDETARLSLHCKFVMTHFSSAISYPVLLRKSILLLSFDKLKIQPQGLSMKYIKELLKCEQIDIDGTFNLTAKLVFKVDESKYKNYEEKYISNVSVVSENSFSGLIDYLTSLD